MYSTQRLDLGDNQNQPYKTETEYFHTHYTPQECLSITHVLDPATFTHITHHKNVCPSHMFLIQQPYNYRHFMEQRYRRHKYES